MNIFNRKIKEKNKLIESKAILIEFDSRTYSIAGQGSYDCIYINEIEFLNNTNKIEYIISDSYLLVDTDYSDYNPPNSFLYDGVYQFNSIVKSLYYSYPGKMKETAKFRFMIFSNDNLDLLKFNKIIIYNGGLKSSICWVNPKIVNIYKTQFPFNSIIEYEQMYLASLSNENLELVATYTFPNTYNADSYTAHEFNII